MTINELKEQRDTWRKRQLEFRARSGLKAFKSAAVCQGEVFRINAEIRKGLGI